jgi:tight adherence protein C
LQEGNIVNATNRKLLSAVIYQLIVLWSVLLALAVLASFALYRAVAARRAYERLYEDAGRDGEHGAALDLAQHGLLRRWLYLAGYRNRSASLAFVVSTILASALGALMVVAVHASGLHALATEGVAVVPGGIGDVFLPVVWSIPWLLLVLLAFLPWWIVSRTRRRRVTFVEQDLPLALELLATLSEAGLGFDAALARILETRLAARPLAQEFRSFQADLLAGRPRIESLRRLSARLQVSAVTLLVSALVQAEQLGMGIAGVLRQQADDVRARRRERAMAFANALPVKRLFPLVICFLPGLFVWTLGPAFVQLIQMADMFFQMREF